jgi:undecaprenyl-diphosphatase
MIEPVLQQIAAVDRFVADWLQAHADESVTAAMALVSRWHRPPFALVATIVLGAILWWRRDREALWILLLAVPLGTALNHVLKHTIRHPRPVAVEPGASTDFSFPSGHVATATLVYGFVAAMVLLRAANWQPKAAALVAAASLVVVVAASRLVLQAHHFSDVVAAAVGGVAWLAACVFVVRR